MALPLQGRSLRPDLTEMHCQYILRLRTIICVLVKGTDYCSAHSLVLSSILLRNALQPGNDAVVLVLGQASPYLGVTASGLEIHSEMLHTTGNNLLPRRRQGGCQGAQRNQTVVVGGFPMPLIRSQGQSLGGCSLNGKVLPRKPWMLLR